MPGSSVGKPQDANIIDVVKELVNTQPESLLKFTILQKEYFKEMLAATSSGVVEVEAKLPKLDLKTFYGSYAQWVEFFDTLKCAVDSRTKLVPVQKLQFKVMLERRSRIISKKLGFKG